MAEVLPVGNFAILKHGLHDVGQLISTAELRTCGGNRSGTGTEQRIDASAIDFVSILSGSEDLWIFPAEVLHGRRSVTLGPRMSQYKVL